MHLGLEKVPPQDGWEGRTKKMRSAWKTVVSDDVSGVYQPLVYRGILPYGRYTERDLAVTGGTRGQ
jgi:hypothetical protein